MSNKFLDKFFTNKRLIQINEALDMKNHIMIDHIIEVIFSNKASIETRKAFCQLLVKVKDPIIDIWFKDWHNQEKLEKSYRSTLNVICPILIKETKKLQKTSEEINDKMD